MTPSRADVSIVCRGSVRDGMGHLTRSASLAAALEHEGVATRLVAIGDTSAEGVLRDLGMPGLVVGSEPEAVGRVAERDPRVVVFDTVEVADTTFAELTRHRVSVSISPVFTHQHRVDRSFSRTVYEPDAILAADPDRHRRGLDYAIIGSHVAPVSHADFAARVYENPLSVAVCMGGSDASNRTLSVLGALRDLGPPLLLWVMLGEGYAHSYNALADAVRRDSRHEIILARTSRSMWTVLRQANLLLLAGGVTTYEAVHAQLPSINLLFQPEQRYLLRELEERGVARCIPVDDDLPATLQAAVTHLDAHRDDLFMMHRACDQLIDGRGAQRIASCIATMVGGKVA